MVLVLRLLPNNLRHLLIYAL